MPAISARFPDADDILDVEGDPELAGKALQKDAVAGKGTFVSLMGLDRAKQQAAMLVAQANEHLASYGSEADLLRAIANYIPRGTNDTPHRRLSRHIRPYHAGSYGHHPARRKAGG
jgi:geranylgeranyl pyrophosphate synthase